jgi:hypothetical protein
MTFRSVLRVDKGVETYFVEHDIEDVVLVLPNPELCSARQLSIQEAQIA